MADHPDHPNFFRPAEEALTRLINFKTQNPLRVTTAPASYSPSPSPGLPLPSMSPTPSVPRHSPPTPSVPRFQSSRMNIPSTAYAPAYTSATHAPPASYIPRITTPSSSPQPPSPQVYEPQVYPEPLECMTYYMVYDRIYLVLRNNLTDWWAQNTEALHHVTYRLTAAIINAGVRGMFGPDGLSSLYQIGMYTGHEGIYRYMCLAVLSDHGELSILIKGDLCEKDGKDPAHDEEMLALCKDGFDKGVAKLYASIITEASKLSHGIRGEKVITERRRSSGEEVSRN